MAVAKGGKRQSQDWEHVTECREPAETGRERTEWQISDSGQRRQVPTMSKSLEGRA